MNRGYSIWQVIERAHIEQIDKPDGEVKLWLLIRRLFFASLDRARKREGKKLVIIVVIDPPKNMALVEMPPDIDIDKDLKALDDDEDGL